MTFEAEVIPLFIGGVSLTFVLKLVLGCLAMKTNKNALALFVCHTIIELLSLIVLMRWLFANWFNIFLGEPSISNSVSVGSFGLLWFFSVIFLLLSLRKNNNK